MTTRVSSPPTSAAPSSSEMQAVSTSGVDPFLGQGTPSEFHARQNSADSGLGKLGNIAFQLKPKNQYKSCIILDVCRLVYISASGKTYTCNR